ncbi:tetratricopeptide repeat protein [Ancylomarina sp.]|uniref:ATP-binding protein n=1 Tax=Ancylomarina sp. TaxID=1970196 RepID=UPI0035616D35
MRYLPIFFLFILLSQFSYGQNKIDSLKLDLNKSEEKDKAYIYYLLAKEVFYKDTYQLISYSKKADSLAERFQIDSIKVNALNLLSYASIHTGKLDDAIAYNKKALDISESKHLNKEKISSHFFKGYLLYATGQSDSSINVLNGAYKEALNSKELEIQLQCLNTIAANHLNQGQYKDALEKFTSAYQLADSLKLYDKLINLSLNIGTTFLYNEELDKAIEYFEKVIANSDTSSISLAYASALNNIGSCHSRMAKHEKALEYFEKALPAHLKMNNKLQIAQVYANLGQSHFFLNNSELASKYLQNAIRLNRKNKSQNHLIVNLILIAKLDISQKKFIQAEYHLDEALELTNKFNINYNKTDLYQTYSSYFTTTKQFRKALEYKQKELYLKDSLFNITRQQQISELQTKFETKQKLVENESLRKDISLNELQIEKQNQNNNYLILLSFIVIILILILLNRARIKKRSIQIIQDQKLELEILNKTKDKFFSIIAHDLRSPFNALIGLSSLLHSSYNNLSDKERKDFINDINTASENAYGLLDNLLTWSIIQQGNIVIQRNEENISALIQECILPLQATAKLKNITINYSDTEKQMVAIDIFSIRTVILNLISNAIKFTHEGGEINLSSEKKGTKTIVSISDNGIGMTQEQIDQLFKIDQGYSTTGTNNETGTGLGLILCQEFVQKNNGQIWIESTKEIGSTFKFSLDTVIA